MIAAGHRADGAMAPAGLLGMMVTVLLVAVFARWLAYTGFFGSDEVTYIASAFRILDGDWTLDDYVGANRLGVNLPMAAFAAAFGRNEFGAALYSLLSSIGEVLLVAWIGARLFGLRAGLIAGLLLATLPTHVHFAGRIMADAPLSLFITASFVAFIEGEWRRSSALMALAGVLAGLTFLIKPVVIIVFGILLFYPLVVRRWDHRWWWMVAGFVGTMALNGLLYMALTGRFWYVFESIVARRQSGYLEAGVAAGEIHNEPAFYLTYLFGRVYHTGLLGYLAVLGAAWLVFRRRAAEWPAGRFVLFWVIGAMLLFSVLPVSFNPLLLIPKQTNYMLIFVAPLCLLAGVGLARLPTPVATILGALAMGVGLVFALMLQASVAAFTANSQRTLAELEARPVSTLHVMANAYRAASFQALVGRPDLRERVVALGAAPPMPQPFERLVVIDPETFEWDNTAPLARWNEPPACWQLEQTWTGEPSSRGTSLVRAMDHLAGSLPMALATRVQPRLRALIAPRPAQVYRVPAGC